MACLEALLCTFHIHAFHGLPVGTLSKHSTGRRVATNEMRRFDVRMVSEDLMSSQHVIQTQKHLKQPKQKDMSITIHMLYGCKAMKGQPDTLSN